MHHPAHTSADPAQRRAERITAHANAIGFALLLPMLAGLIALAIVLA